MLLLPLPSLLLRQLLLLLAVLQLLDLLHRHRDRVRRNHCGGNKGGGGMAGSKGNKTARNRRVPNSRCPWGVRARVLDPHGRMMLAWHHTGKHACSKRPRPSSPSTFPPTPGPPGLSPPPRPFHPPTCGPGVDAGSRGLRGAACRRCRNAAAGAAALRPGRPRARSSLAAWAAARRANGRRRRRQTGGRPRRSCGGRRRGALGLDARVGCGSERRAALHGKHLLVERGGQQRAVVSLSCRSTTVGTRGAEWAGSSSSQGVCLSSAGNRGPVPHVDPAARYGAPCQTPAKPQAHAHARARATHTCTPDNAQPWARC